MRNTIFVILLSFLSLSCKKLESPVGFIGAKDIDSPMININEPLNNAIVKDSLIIQFEIKDASEIMRIEFVFGNKRLYSELISNQGNNYTYKVEVAFSSGSGNLAVQVFDAAGNFKEANLAITVVPVIRQVHESETTHDLDVQSMSEYGNDKVWFGSGNGVYEYSSSGFAKVITGGYVKSLAMDSKGTMWMIYKKLYSSEDPRLLAYQGTNKAGDYIIDREFWTTYPHGFSSFYFDQYDSLWGIWTIYSAGGYFSYKDNKWNSRPLNGDYITGFAIDKFNRKWFATSEGVFYVDDNGLHNTNYPLNYASGLLIDNQNNIVTIDRDYNNHDFANQLLKYDGVKWKAYNFFAEKTQVKDFLIDNEMNLWVAARGYLWKFNAEIKYEKRYYFLNGPEKLFKDSNNNIWIYSEYGLYRLNEKE